MFVLIALIALVALVALACVFRAIESAKIDARRASASHTYLTSNTYSKWSK